MGVLAPRSGASGILVGEYTYRENGTCKLTFLDGDARNADVAVGDSVETSGTGSVYPAGLKVGKITELKADAATRSLIATVEPSVDFSSVSYVMIITGYQEKG